ncbi:SHOCT domain-containing protein [Streptomyces sp. JV185]|uniref:SHOCT domain-containing protein n=1 Tax=unclassified Streptomyces TaxID=2593676 RepID=UPI002E770787|nr:SHOCT domain-containing protein [Streptomyces sp. JV185]MEE1767269.1 SHOCT domain-containing protein [Streptomyces sp. JV185]
MNTLAYSAGPGPWILLFPLFWAAVVIGGVTLLRRTARRGRRGPCQARTTPEAPAEPSPITLLGRRFAAGEIDEEDYWRRLSVLDEQFGRGSKGGLA